MKNTLHTRFLALAFGAATLLGGAGCHKATFVDPVIPSTNAQQVEKWNNFYLFGLVGEQNVDVRRLCESEAAQVRTGGNVGTDVLAIVTLGIYTPRKVYVTCTSPAQQPYPATATAGVRSTEAHP